MDGIRQLLDPHQTEGRPRYPTGDNRGGSGPKRDDLQGARYIRANFSDGSKAITTDVFKEKNKPEWSNPIFEKLKDNDWTRQVLYLKMTASARGDMADGANCITWDEVPTEVAVAAATAGNGRSQYDGSVNYITFPRGILHEKL